MAMRLEIGAFLRASGPLIDVRSPGEFAQGHIPGATNLPLFSDEERAAVGTAYKQEGRPEALLLGLRLVGPKLASLGEELLGHRDPQGAPLRLHCWRGGQRSASVAWLAESLDLETALLEGGYKSFRGWVLAQFERPWPLRLLGGRTGCGKTELLHALAQRGASVVDLEGLAHHRGSSFGGLGLPPQPSSEHYENLLAVDLLSNQGSELIWLEAESAQVGRCRIPRALWNQMQAAPVLEIHRPLEERLQRLVIDYGHQDPRELEQATLRIASRLGPQRTAAALEALAQGDWSGAAAQMLDYYDRCYDHESERRCQGKQPGEPALDLTAMASAEAAERVLEMNLVRGTA